MGGEVIGDEPGGAVSHPQGRSMPMGRRESEFINRIRTLNFYYR